MISEYCISKFLRNQNLTACLDVMLSHNYESPR